MELGHKINSSVPGENTGWFQPPCTKLVFFLCNWKNEKFWQNILKIFFCEALLSALFF